MAKHIHTDTCYCDAYPFPHRKGGGQCNAHKLCPHGVPTPDHPDYDPSVDRCNECAYWDRVDYAYDSRFDR